MQHIQTSHRTPLPKELATVLLGHDCHLIHGHVSQAYAFVGRDGNGGAGDVVRAERTRNAAMGRDNAKAKAATAAETTAGGLCASIVINNFDDDDLGVREISAAAVNTGKAADATKADAG